MSKEYKVKLVVTYEVFLLAKAKDVDGTVDEVEAQLKKMDDYEIVNRSVTKSYNIEEIVEVENRPKNGKKTGRKNRRT